MNKNRLVVFLAFLLAIPDSAYATDWRLFALDEKTESYYDNDSIHYPSKTKGFLGLGLKIDKNIVNVWIKTTLRGTEGEAFDINSALEKGWTYERIGRFLADKMGFHYDRAIEAGFSPEEITRRLSGKPERITFHCEERLYDGVPVRPDSEMEKAFDVVCR